MRAMATDEKRSRSIMAVMILFGLTLPVSGGSAASDCGPSTSVADVAVHSLSAVVDPQRAELSRRRHLEALFNR